MSGRSMDAAVKTAFGAAILNIAWIVRLDILGDPVYAWTGLGPLVVGASQYPDAQINGRTYTGLANIGEIGKIVETMQGSQAVRLALPGIQLDNEALRQVVFNQNAWQGRRGFLWVVPLGDNGALLGAPVRAKTGRMDNLKIEKRQDSGIVRVDLEGFASYSQRALLTRYSEQAELDATDTSQKYVHDLANRVAGIGDKANATTGVQSGGGSTASIGRSGGGRFGGSELIASY